MGIKFRCHGCQKKLHVKSFLAGKRGICPQCGARFRIPLEDTAVAPALESSSEISRSAGAGKPEATSTVRRGTLNAGRSGRRKKTADPLQEVPDAVWYVRPPTGGQFGPADGPVMRRWVDEGRVGADSFVWREGWPDWRQAESVFPELVGHNELDPLPAVATATVPTEDLATISLAADTPGGSTTSKRPGRRAKKQRHIAILVVLSLVCVALLTALILVLNRQS